MPKLILYINITKIYLDVKVSCRKMSLKYIVFVEKNTNNIDFQRIEANYQTSARQKFEFSNMLLRFPKIRYIRGL